LDALGRVLDRTVERCPACAQPEGGHHQSRESEYELRLPEALTFLEPDETICVDVHVFQDERSRVAQADAVLILRLARRKAFGAALDHEPRGPARCLCKHGVNVGVAAIGDPLLVSGDLVPRDLTVPFYGYRNGFERCEVAAGGRLGRPVGH
jgi:hypothetical protein